MRISSGSWNRNNRFWCLWSLFFTTKWEFGGGFLYRMSFLLVLKWTWYKFGFPLIIDTASFTLTKFRVSIIFVNSNWIIVSWAWYYFWFLTTHNTSHVKFRAHWPTQLNIRFVFSIISSRSWSSGAIFRLSVIYNSHGIFRSFNGLLWNGICTGSKLFGCSCCLKLCSLTCSETPFWLNLLILFLSRCVCSRSWNMFSKWWNCNFGSLFFANTVCLYHCCI